MSRKRLKREVRELRAALDDAERRLADAALALSRARNRSANLRAEVGRLRAWHEAVAGHAAALPPVEGSWRVREAAEYALVGDGHPTGVHEEARQAVRGARTPA